MPFDSFLRVSNQSVKSPAHAKMVSREEGFGRLVQQDYGAFCVARHMYEFNVIAAVGKLPGP